jgi:hypothetical protein
MLLKPLQIIILISFFLLLNCCVEKFIPQTDDNKKLLVVEGLITDRSDTNTIRLSRSLPLGVRIASKPVKGYIVTISDDLGNTFNFKETAPGTYVSDPAEFHGVVGRFYTLHINTNDANNNLNYESYALEMKPVPPIDSVYYEKKTIKEIGGIPSEEGCQVYLNTFDPANQCKFYRWDYTETWEFHLPYWVPPNRVCWITNKSNVINIKNTSVLTEDRIIHYPINFISNETDRLNVNYSILVNQYSLNEDEYFYWQKLQSITENVGSLYDITPASIPSNIFCIENPNETVLGYFSVSAISSQRIFIKDRFSGFADLYTKCNDDTIFNGDPVLYTIWWKIIDHPVPPPNYIVITFTKGCADCTVRGTNKQPDFWNESK